MDSHEELYLALTFLTFSSSDFFNGIDYKMMLDDVIITSKTVLSLVAHVDEFV